MQAKRRSADLEAQPVDPSDATSVLDGPAKGPTPQYKTQGRGGAGNWYEPAALKEKGSFVSSDPVVTSDADPTKRSSRVWQGRGGAGNWEADQAIKEELKRKSQVIGQSGDNYEAEVLERIRQQAEKDAEKEIKPPQSAHVHVPHLDRHQNLGGETHDI